MQAASCRLRTNVFTRPLIKSFRYFPNFTLPIAASQFQGRYIVMDAKSREQSCRTKILPIDPTKIRADIIPLNISSNGAITNGHISEHEDGNEDYKNLHLAAHALQTSDIPVAFPTETVYGLGADATRSAAVKGIYKAKQRPSDNPLIVHFASLQQLLLLLRPPNSNPSLSSQELWETLIPPIYKPLILRFWPGPLTIILPNPPHSPLASEVTAGLNTFGARIPRNLLALLLIKFADVPLAAPSANASTKPSPTAAEHVVEDLDGRIEYIVDGGPCDVGVESTVVDGLSSPPVILRPGGVSIEQLRECPGWGDVRVGYKDKALEGGDVPRAPGMKYRHYSPKAAVVLYEVGAKRPGWKEVEVKSVKKVGLIRTKTWPRGLGLLGKEDEVNGFDVETLNGSDVFDGDNGANGYEETSDVNRFLDATSFGLTPVPTASHYVLENEKHQLRRKIDMWDIDLGPKTEDIARGLFSALRELDRRNVDIIFVEGINDEEGDVAAAIMNRLRKAAEAKVG